MFVCGFCKNLTQSGEAGKLIVVSRRVKEYPAEIRSETPGEFKSKFTKAGKGHEIEIEKRACQKCINTVEEAPVPA